VVISALLYMTGMAHLEGEPRSFWSSLEWAGETLTTTGYGADAGWKHPAMVLFAVALQFFGVLLVFLIVPIEIDPLLKVQKLSRVPLAGHHPAELGIRERTGCSVVAVERGDEVMVEFGADFRFAPDDGIYVSGSSEAVRRFAESLGAA
jgi:hypothetical protein